MAMAPKFAGLGTFTSCFSNPLWALAN